LGKVVSKKQKEGGGRLIANHPSRDGRVVAVIQKNVITDIDHLSDFLFKTEILGGLNEADVEFVDPSVNDGGYGIVGLHLTMPIGLVRLD
jgi:hypothetical protein